ncbi:Alstrom syndrome protein 1 homolog isoform X3 [Nannospalax galili]|uniref:Alstrom syndrome protein 1 homolog isoform X3 n=1 Tax=Nannospalax galili TaxID=1026970 RepID=UPI00111C8BDE|nr:Alstrom syndrome protein 1 homolog isoform X3 [Nannospalax galili]
MEPKDLRWPGELEEKEEEEDEMAKAWLQVQPGGAFPPPLPTRHSYAAAEWTPAEQRAESWHHPPQERDSSQSLDTSQTRITMGAEGIEVTDFPSLEEGELTQSEGPVQEPKLDLLCSPLLVIQDNFATPDLPLLTCLTQDQEFEPDSLFQQSELEFAPLRGIPDKPEDSERLSRPSEVSEALFQAALETSSDLVNSCLSISQHPLTGSTTFGSQRSLFPPEQENNGENGLSKAADELKTPNDSDHYNALYSYMSWQARKDTQQPEDSLTDKNQVSTSAFSDVSDESITTKRDDGFDASCSQVQYWKQGASQQAETCLDNKDHRSFPCEIAPPCPNKVSYSFLQCMLERGKGALLTSESHPENVCLRAPAEDEMNQNVGSLEGYERNEDLQKELSQYFKLKESRNNLLSSELHSTSPEIKYIRTVVPDDCEQVSGVHILSRGLDISKMEAAGGPLRSVKSNLDETSQQLYFQEDRNRKAASVFGEKNVDATENVAFEAVIASIEPSKQESPVSEVQTDINKSLADESQEREPPNPHISPLNYNNKNSFIDKLKHPKYQSTTGVLEPAASKPVLHKEDDGAGSLYLYPNLKSPSNAARSMLSQPFSFIPEHKSSPLSEKAYNQAVGLGETQSPLFPYDICSLDLTEKGGSSNIIYPMKVSTSDSWVVRDLKQQTFEEVADSSDYYLEGLQGKAGSDVITLDGDTEYSSLHGNAVAHSKRVTELQRQICGLHGLTGEFLELADLDNLLDDLCDSSLYWLPSSKLSSKESNFEKLGDRSNLSTSQPFPSALPPFVPQEPTSESEYHSSNLRMLRVSPDALPATLRRLTGDTSKGGIAALTQCKLKSDTTASLGDSPTGPPSSLPLEDLPQLAVRSLQENTVGHHAYAINQKALTGSHLTEESLKVSDIPESADQKTGILAVPSTSYSYRENPSILSGGHLTGQSLTVSAITTTDLKTGAIALPSSSYSQNEKPGIFYQQELTDSYPTEEVLKVVSGPVDQKTGITITSSISHSHREKPGSFYQQVAPEGHLSEEAPKTLAHLGLAEQNMGTSPVIPTSFSQRETPTILYQEGLQDGPQIAQALTVLTFPGQADQKSGLAMVSSTSSSQRNKPGILYQQAMPGSHLPKENVKASAALGPTDQKSGLATVLSTSYSQRDKPGIFYQQASKAGGNLPEDILKTSADQKFDGPAITATTYSYREESSIFYQQELPEGHLTDKTMQGSALPGPTDQNVTILSSTSHLHGEKSHTYQALPENYLSHQTWKVSSVPGSADQIVGAPGILSTYSNGIKPGSFSQEEWPDRHLTEETQKASASPGLADQKPGTPTIHSSSYSQGMKPGIFCQQLLSHRHPSKESLDVSAVSRSSDQKTWAPTVTSASQPHRETAKVFYQQTLSDSHLTEEALPVPVVPSRSSQKTSLPSESSGSSSHREPIVSPKQTLPSTHLPEDAVKVSADSGSADQNANSPTMSSSSYSHKKKPSIYQQELPGSHVPTGTWKIAFVPESTAQKPGMSHLYSEKPIVFFQQELPDSYPVEKPTKALFVPGPADQLSGVPTLTTASYSCEEKPSISYQQKFPDSHLTENMLKVSGAPGPADQKTGTSKVSSTSYSRRERPGIFYEQALPDGPVSEEALKASTASRPADQSITIPSITSTFSQREKPGGFYQQAMPGVHLPGVSLKASAAPEPADQNTGTLAISSGPHPLGEESIIFYQSRLLGSPLSAENFTVPLVSGATEQKTDTPTGVSIGYPGSHPVGEKHIIFYQQALPDSHLPKETLNVLTSPGPVDLKTGEPTIYSTSYPFGEKPIILYQQALPEAQLTKEGHKVSVVSGPVDQKTGIPLITSSSCPNLENVIDSYQQELPDGHLTENTKKVSVVPGPTDQKTGIPTVPPTSSCIVRPSASYQQELPDLSEKALKALGVVRPAQQKTGIQILSSTPYSHKGRPSISFQQELPDLTKEALQVLGVPGVSKQKTEVYIVPSVPYSHEEKPIISYQQELPDLTEEALKTGEVPGSTDGKTRIQIVSSGLYLSREKPDGFHQQELPNFGEEALGVFVHPGPVVQKVGIPVEPLSYYSQREPSAFSPQELPASHLTEEALNVPALSVLGTQKPGAPSGPSSSYFHREKLNDFYQRALPYHHPTEGSLKASTVPGLYDQNRRPTVPSGSCSFKEKVKISTADLLHDQKTKLPTAAHSSYLNREKPVISTVIRPDDQKTPLLTVFHGSYPQRIKPVIFFQKQLPGRDQSEDTLKISTDSEPTDVNTETPVLLSGSYSHTEKADTFYPQELPDRHLTEDAPKGSSGLGQVDQIAWVPTVSLGIYSHDEKHQLVSEHAQRPIDNLNSPDSFLRPNNMPLNSQIDDAVIISKPESSTIGDVGYEEIRDADNSSKTLKEIRTLLMEAENIALKGCNFPAPLVLFRDVSDVSFIQSKKVVCFKEPSTTDVCNQRDPVTEECPRMQKDIGTQTNLKYQRGIENWEFISSTTIRSPLQEAEDTARVAFDETFRQYEAARSAMRSEPEGYSAAIGNKIVIPMMTIIKSDSNSDISDGCCSRDSNLPESLESASDIFLNSFPYTSPKTSMTDSRDEEGLSENEDSCGSIDSLAAHVKYLLQCESSLNQAKQILRNAEEEECRVQAQAWNLKFNLGHDYGYSISELNEDDRKKVEEIKAKLFGHERAAHVSEDLQSPWGIGCVPKAVCGHIIIESHEKGCFRTLTAEQPHLHGHPCVLRSADPSEVIRGRRSPSSWRTRHINISKSLDQSNPRFKVWDSLQLQSHPPFQQLTPEDFKISKGVGVSFNANFDPRLSELVEPTCMPSEEMDFPSSTQTSPPEPMKQFTTSITLSSHQHPDCISDTSVFKVGVTEGSQCTGPSGWVCKSHKPEEQISPKDLTQKTPSPSSLKRHSHSPVTILAEGDRQRHKLPVDSEHSHQKGKLLERSYFKASHSDPSVSTNYSNFKGVQFSHKDILIILDKLSSTSEVKEKNVALTPDLSSCIFLEQQELFEQSHTPHTDHHVRKYRSPSCPDIASCIFLEQQELFEQSKAPHTDHTMREDHALLPQCHDYIVSDLPSVFLEQQQYKSQDVDDHMRNLSQGQCSVVEKIECIPKSHFSNLINVEAKFSNMISQSAPDHCTSASTPPSNRKAISCVHITLCPKTPSKLDSGTDERFHSLDPASKTRINSEFNCDLQTISSRSLEPTSKLLTCKPVAQDQEFLGFQGPKSPLDLEVVQSSLPASKTVTQDLKTIPPQNSQMVISRQTQVNISDLEGPQGTPVSADGSRDQSETPSGKLFSDAVTQITTESPEKTTFSSEIFINAGLDPTTQKPHKFPVKFASSSSVQQHTASRGKDAQRELLPYKPSGSSKMYYVPQLKTVPSFPDFKSDTTVESSHPEAPVQAPITGDVQKEIISGVFLTKTARPEEKESLQDTTDSCDAAVQDRKTERLADTKFIKQTEETCVKRTIHQEVCPEKEKSLETDSSESECHSSFENTTHSAFRSAKFCFDHPVHLPHEQDICHESLGRSVSMQHSRKDFFHHHSDTHREHSCLPPPHPSVDKMDYSRIKSLSINLNLGDIEKMHTTKSQSKDHPKSKTQMNDPKKELKVTPELTAQCTVSLNELWNKYQERQKQQKPPDICDKKELSLVERLHRLAKLLQNPITHSLQFSESTQDDSRRGHGARGQGGGRQQQQKSRTQKQKWCKSLEKGPQNAGYRGPSRELSPQQDNSSSQIKTEQIKLNKYILRKQPDFNFISNSSLDSRPSEESELLTDSPTNCLSSTTSPLDSDVLTQTDREVTLHERSSSISTIDTARLVQAFGRERLYLSPRRIKLYSSITNQQRRYLEKRCKHNKKTLNTGHPQMTSEHTRRRHIQVADHLVSSDSVSSTSSFLSLNSTPCNEQSVHLLNKSIQTGNFEIMTGTKKHTRDVGVTFPTPSSSEARLEDSDMTSCPEEKVQEKMFFISYLGNKKLQKDKPKSCKGVSWFVPVEYVKSASKKENLPNVYVPGITWFEPVTRTKPWREPLREQNWQGQCTDGWWSLGGPGGDGGCVPPRPFVRATLQEALQLHRPDFISRSGERIKRLKLTVQERKLQNMFQSERDVLFNVHPLRRRVFLAPQNKPIGKKEMIQRSKRIYEQLPEVKKKREEEKRKSEYKSYRLRAQHYKMKVTNQLLGRKVPWD